MKIIKASIIQFIIFLTLFLPAKVIAQYYVVGQDPSSIKWKQINSPTIKIIFPEGYETKAQEYANLIELSHKSVSLPYIEQNKKFQIVLHNRSVTSNAMVSPTPMHADFFEMPDQNTYAQTWAKQLTLHEYRHVVQMQKLNQGFTKGLTYAFGEQAIGGIMGVFLPFWFIEGDAVFSETIYSSSGRGRSPDFTMDLKAQVLDKRIYPYDKALYGSYKDYVPDHYTLGYELVVNGNINYGEELWNNTLNNVARRPYTFIPFTKSVKDKTGVGKVGYYKKTLESSKKCWANIDSTKTKTSIIIPQKEDFFTSYRFVNPLKDGSFIVEKSSIDDINRFVKVYPDGSEEKIFTPGYDFTESLSANDSLLCWNEKTFDPRWSNRDYSVIKIYNYKRKKLKQLTRKSRLFSPSLANNSSKIVAVNVNELNQYSLQVIDISTKEIINEFNTPDNLFFTHPRWSDNDNFIVAVVLGEKGKSIILINTKTWKYEFVLPFSYVDIKRPVINGNKIMYSGTYEGTSDLYMIDISRNQTFKLTNVRFGASDAVFSVDKKEVHFVSYTSDGYRIASIPLTNKKSDRVELPNLKTNYIIDQLSPENGFNLDDSIVPQKEYPVKKYSRSGHLFNLHSWGLAAVDLNNYDFQPGVNILTQNILSTAYGSIGYYYDPNENAGKTKLDFTYAGWYPLIKLSSDYGLRRTNYLDTNNVSQEIKWMETNLALGISIPLSFTSGIWFMGIQPYVNGSQKFLNKVGESPANFSEDQITSLSYGLFAYTQYKRSKKDIFPKWGFATNIFYRHTPFSKSVSINYGWAETYYFPGIFNHHGIRLYSAFQYNQKGNYSYSNMVSTPRGYTGINLNNMISLKAEYALPIIYPDLDIQAVAYLKRVTLHVYYDYVTGDNYHGNTKSYSSAGLELYSDWNFLSLIPNIKLGVRSNYRFFDEQVNFEFLYGFSIN